MSTLSPEELDNILIKCDSGMEVALKRAKAWSKYAKDIISYVEKRAALGKIRSNLSPFIVNLVQSCIITRRRTFSNEATKVLARGLSHGTPNSNSTPNIVSDMFTSNAVELHPTLLEPPPPTHTHTPSRVMCTVLVTVPWTAPPSRIPFDRQSNYTGFHL